MSEKLFKNAIQAGSKISYEKIEEAELAAQRKAEAERKAEQELEENARNERKAKEYKFAASCAIKMFSKFRIHALNFETFVQYCNREGSDQTNGLTKIFVQFYFKYRDEVQGVLILVKVIGHKSDKPPYGLTYQYISGKK